MTTPVFPSFPGQAIGIKRTPLWRTGVQSSLSGKETRLAYMSYPLYQWSLDLSVLRSYASYAELAQIIGLINTVQGMAGNFLFMDPEDNAVSGQSFGTGDGSTKVFQLVRAYGGYTEPVQQPLMQTDGSDATFSVKVNGTSTSAFSFTAPGVITFSSAPASGAALTWSGAFRFLCRFLQDNPQFTQEFIQAWSITGLQFQSVKL